MNTPQNVPNTGFPPLDVTATLNTNAVDNISPQQDHVAIPPVAAQPSPSQSIPGFENNVAAQPQGGPQELDQFIPRRPQTLKASGLKYNDMSPLLLKFLFLHGVQSGIQIANQVKLPFEVVEPLMAELKADLLVSIKSASVVGDYVFELTPKGVEQAKLSLERSTYCGAAPVSLAEYTDGVKRQSVKNAKPNFGHVSQSMQGLVISQFMVSQLGQAINSGRSMFLYGPPGNGKSTIAKRLINSISKAVWIPRSISVGGDVIRLFDPIVHNEVPMPENQGITCLLYTSPSPRDLSTSRMPSSA